MGKKTLREFYHCWKNTGSGDTAALPVCAVLFE